MNFLGHLYFSNNQTELMYPNLYGDFVKGSDLSSYPERIQKGILLHRKIDDYIDRHSIILELAHFLYPKLPKITGIAIDLYFDHLLAIHWEKYHSTPLTTFIERFNSIEEDRFLFENEHFWMVMDKMKAGEWLKHSVSTYGLTKSCEGVSRLISFENELSKAPKVFIEHQSRIEKTFFEFMEEAIPFFKKYISKM